TGAARARAALRQVTVTRRGPALDRRRLERIRRALRARPGARLGDVAGAHGRAADGRRRREAVRGAGGLAAVAGLGQVASAGGRAGAGLRQVAWPRRGSADRSRIARRVRARGAHPVALVGGAGVPVVRAGGPGRLLGVVRAARAAAGAELGDVALVGGRPALR